MPFLRDDESSRLHDLRRYQILDTPPEQAYDDLVKLAAQICQAPVALISLVDCSRQWFKAKVGLDICETSREVAFCHYTIQHPEAILIVADATQDPRFCQNPLVTDDPKIRFYAGCPLVTPRGKAVGTLCIIDYEVRNLSLDQQAALGILSRQAVHLLEMRLALQAEQRLQQFKSQLITQINHEIRTPLGIISSSAGILEDYGQKLNVADQRKHHRRIQTAVTHMIRLVDGAIALDELENGQFTPLIETCDVSELCNHLAAEIKSSYDRQVMCLTFPEVESVQLKTDRRILESVVFNLLVNAVQYSPHNSLINLDIIAKERALLIRVEDQGLGNPCSDMCTTFSEKSAIGVSSIGLNLTHSYRLAERMGWQLNLQNEAGSGTTAYIHIPVSV